MSEKDKKLVDFVMDNFTYKTTLSEKYKNKKDFTLPDSKKQYSVLPGTIKEVKVGTGSEVQIGDPLLVFESMKMNNVLLSSYSGKVKKVYVKKNDVVPNHYLLVEFL